MSRREDRYRRLAYIALREFPDVVVGTEIVEGKLRILIADESFIDVWSDAWAGDFAFWLSFGLVCAV